MTLILHDTLAREKRPFVPRDPSRVTLYVCGPTVYDHAHIGNARPVVVFDTLFRLLRHTYGEAAVVYARNVTDVDDKINRKAADEGVDIKVVTDRYLAAYDADMAALGALPPTLTPHATDHIQDMLAQIGRLVEGGHAYAAEGHVLFDTTSDDGYGQLSGRNLDEMIAGARVEVAPYKKNAADFVLWKPSRPGEPVWPSPWGPGRPGWHIECSAMIETVLGLPIDIHGGGIDLVFPHHENERAQGRCAHAGGEFSRYWMHNGFLDMSGEKMSKSLGNVVIPHELLKAVPGEVVRWALLSAHYRQPLDWTDTLLEQSRKNLDRLYGVVREASARLAELPREVIPDALPTHDDPGLHPFLAALSDDLNTPAAMAELFRLADDLRRVVGTDDGEELYGPYARLLRACALLGVMQGDVDAWFEGDDPAFAARVEALLTERIAARAARDWTRADAIRDELTALRVVVMDGPTGATWRKA